MKPIMEDIFLESVKKRFRYYKDLGEKAMAQLEPAQLFLQPNLESNSIAMIVQHMSGNMLSRWTDLLTTDGEKEWRNRDEEFEVKLTTLEEVMAAWENGWTVFLRVLDELKTTELSQVIYIRNEPLTVMDAVNRQLAHYPYHVGQIVYYAKILKEGNWNNLSIPRTKKIDPFI